MKENKLIKILSTFSIEEIKEFKKFLSSPYLNKGRDYTELFKKIIRHHPDSQKMSFVISDYVSKSKSPKSASNKIVHITKLALDFLYINDIKIRSGVKYYQLSSILIKRGLINFALESCHTGEREIKKLFHGENYNDLYRIYRNESLCFFKKIENKKGFEALNESVDYFWLNLLINLMRLNQQVFLYKSNTNFDVDTNYISKVLDVLDPEIFHNILKRGNIKNVGLIKFTLYTYENLNKPKTLNYFKELVKIYKKYYKEFDGWLAHTLTSDIYNVGAEVAIKTKENVLPDLFEFLRNFMLRIFNDRKYPSFQMESLLFTNAVYLALKLDEFEWTERFINKYKTKLSPLLRDDLVNYGLGMLFFYKKNFTASLEYINKVKQSFEILKYDVRIMQLELYYELKYFDQIEDKIIAFRQFIQKTEKTFHYITKSINKFLFFFSILLRCSENGDFAEIDMSIKKLENEEDFLHKEWIIDKFKELKFLKVKIN